MYSSSTEQTGQHAPKRPVLTTGNIWLESLSPTKEALLQHVAMFGDSSSKLNQYTHVWRNGDGRKPIVTGSLSGPL